MRLRHSSAAFVLAAALLSTGCGGSKETAGKNGAARNTSPAGPVPVSMAMANVEQIPIYIDATGTFVAEESSDVAPLAPGRVVATPVDVGAYVQKGDVLVRLDNSDARLRLQQAQATAEQTAAAVR